MSRIPSAFLPTSLTLQVRYTDNKGHEVSHVRPEIPALLLRETVAPNITSDNNPNINPSKQLVYA